MTLEQYAYIAEIIGVVLVVASLIYLALQIRQNTDMMRAESRNEIYHGHQGEAHVLVEQPDVWRGITGEELSDRDVRLHGWLIMHFRAREHEWFQVRHGALDRAAWESYSSPIPMLLSSPRLRAWWNLMKAAFDKEFVEQVEKLAENSELGELNRKVALVLRQESTVL